MNCTDVRARLERALPGEPRDGAMTAHLAGCAECRAAAGALALVDARLTAMHARIDVPADFDVRLRARLAQEAQRSPTAADREAIERELDGWRARLRRESWLDGGAIVGAGVAFGIAAWHFAPWVARFYASDPTRSNSLVIGAVAAALALAGAWFALGDARKTLLRR
jgi:glutathione S-transferase